MNINKIRKHSENINESPGGDDQAGIASNENSFLIMDAYDNNKYNRSYRELPPSKASFVQESADDLMQSV